MKKLLFFPFICFIFTGFSQNSTSKPDVKELPAYDFVSNFLNGYAYVQYTKKDSITFGYIDKTGQEVIPCNQKTADSYKNYCQSDLFGDPSHYFISKKGLTVLKKEEQAFLYDVRQKKFFGEGYKRISMFSNNFLAHKNDSILGVMDDNGKLMFEVKTKNIYFLNKNRYIYVDSLSNWCFVDKDNKLIKKLASHEYGQLTVLSEKRLSFTQKDSCGLLDQDGNVVMAPKYNEMNRFQDGFGVAVIYDENRTKREKRYLINENGIPLIIKDSLNKIDEYFMNFFAEGSVRVNVYRNGGYTASLMDSSGNLVIKPVFKTIYNFSDGIAPFQSGLSFGCVDKTGKLLFRTNGLAFFKEGVSVIRNNKLDFGYSMNYEIIDKQGKIIMQTKPVKR